MIRQSFVALASLVFAGAVSSEELVLTPVEVTENVYSVTGALTQPDYDNEGLNNNLSFIVTSDGVLVFNAGQTTRVAEALGRAIKKVTDQPIKMVVNENAQGHAMMGNGYYAKQGIAILAHAEAAKTMDHDQAALLERGRGILKEKFDGTEFAMPTLTFEDKYIIEMGDTIMEARYFGPGHSPGDIGLWIPSKKLLITGDYAFHQRMLGVFPDTKTEGWVESFEKMMALKPEFVIPGHGKPTDAAEIETWTLGYLNYLRDGVEAILDEDGELQEAVDSIDQSEYEHLINYEILAKKNVGRVFMEMEAALFE